MSGRAKKPTDVDEALDLLSENWGDPPKDRGKKRLFERCLVEQVGDQHDLVRVVKVTIRNCHGVTVVEILREHVTRLIRLLEPLEE